MPSCSAGTSARAAAGERESAIAGSGALAGSAARPAWRGWRSAPSGGKALGKRLGRRGLSWPTLRWTAWGPARQGLARAALYRPAWFTTLERSARFALGRPAWLAMRRLAEALRSLAAR